jgi:diaminopimelate epimerase
MSMQFWKYEGLGNDFIVVDVTSPSEVDVARAKRLCDRHFGVGADGVLLVSPPTLPGARATMTVRNADGSEPEMCGNGLRCVALHLAIVDEKNAASYGVETGAGTLRCDVVRAGLDATVRLDLGRAQMLGEHTAEFRGQRAIFQRVSTGNPHAVLIDSKFSLEEIDALAPEVAAAFAGGANVGFLRERPDRAHDLVVHERGVGRTLACGTGAAAAVAALCTAGRAQFGQPLWLHLPGGALEVTVQAGSLSVSLKGPARQVFSGQTLL